MKMSREKRMFLKIGYALIGIGIILMICGLFIWLVGVLNVLHLENGTIYWNELFLELFNYTAVYGISFLLGIISLIVGIGLVIKNAT